MFEAILTAETPKCWIRDVLNKYSASINIIDVKALEGEEGVRELFEIRVASDSVDSLMEDIHRNNYVSEAEFIKPKNGRVYGSAKVLGRHMCMSFIESKCFLTSVSSSPDGKVQWVVQGAGNAFRDLMKRFEKERTKVEVKQVSKIENNKALTTRQETILETALERGYFEFPRKTSLRELAGELGIKPSTLSEILRRAQRKALTEYLQRLKQSSSSGRLSLPKGRH